ncbi:MAG: DUF429 domain-containing protein, partial [Proteobacteria bacterium]|nr:DUF429 domain-containing protein [Pseudomonadota bacterium]
MSSRIPRKARSRVRPTRRARRGAEGLACVAGIDFGARRAGTTVIAWNEGRSIHLECSRPGTDADAFLRAAVKRIRPQVIAIDAPLSLPGVYRKLPGFNDFHLRRCDRLLQAMSPMFLGGLTARAMALAAEWYGAGIEVYESYPRIGAERIGLTVVKEDLAYLRRVVGMHGYRLPHALKSLTEHERDALLAMIPWCCALPLEAVGDKR